MSSKAPIYLKRGDRKGKKAKLRDVLSSDMISPPLGDFRHTIHVGSGGQGDTFGDVSFLQGQFHLLPGAPSDPAAPPFRLTRTATVCGRQQAAQTSSPLLKNAVSLPVIGGSQALSLPSAQAPPKPPRLHLDERSPASAAAAAATAHPPSNGFSQDEGGPEALLPHGGSLLSLHVDLGPSILEDVLQVMERHRGRRESGRLEALT